MCYSSPNRSIIDKRAEYLKTNGAMSEAFRVEDCETHELIFFDAEEKDVKIVNAHCNSYWCPICGPIKMKRVKTQVEKVINHYKKHSLRFVTLTQVDRKEESLETAGARFRKSFNKFKKRKWWKTQVYGYYIKYEATWNTKEKRWHYHAHLLAHSRFLLQKELKIEWMKSSPGAFKQYVQAVNKETAEELSKYITRLKHRESLPLSELTNYMSQHRMFSINGTIRPYFKNVEDQDDTKHYTFYGAMPFFEEHLNISILETDKLIICYHLCKRQMVGSKDNFRAWNPVFDYYLKWHKKLGNEFPSLMTD